MNDTSVKDAGSIVPKDGSSTDGRRAFLDPSADGLANRLTKSTARGHVILAIAIATIASFAVMGIVIVAIGLLITHVLGHGSIGMWDHHVSQWFDNHRSARWNGITGDLTDIADTFEVAGVAAIVTIVVLFRRWGRHAFLLIAGLAIELSVFITANKIVARPRPAVSHLGGTPSTYSFPSGHTAATVVLYGGIAVIVMVATTRLWPRIVMWILAVVLTVAVALSRVYRGEHYPTDVLAGLLLGIGSLVAGVFIIRVAGVNHVDKSDAVTKQISTEGAVERDEASK